MKRVLDTNAVLYLLGGKLAQTLPAGQYFLSIITEMELLSYPLLGASEHSRIQDFLSSVTVIGVTEHIKEIAIRLRRQHLLKLPDAIVSATAMSLGAVLITNDSKLLSLPEVSAQELKLKNG